MPTIKYLIFEKKDFIALTITFNGVFKRCKFFIAKVRKSCGQRVPS